MKKPFTIVMFLALFQLTGYSQKFYFKGQAGYDIGFLKSNMNAYSTDIRITQDSVYESITASSYKYSYGSGVSLNAGAGILISKYIGFELTGFYTFCRQQTMESTFHELDKNGSSVNGFTETNMDGKFYGFKPALVLTLPGEEFHAYSRAGAILGFVKMNEAADASYTTNDPNFYPTAGYSFILEYKSRFTLGLNLAIGAEYMLLSRLWIFGEVEANIVNYIPSGATYTNYISNNHDITNSLTVHEREISFVDSYTYTGSSDEDEPTQNLPVKYSFSSIGINVGLRFTLYD